MTSEQVLSNRKRRVRRSTIPHHEVLISLGIFTLLILICFWVLTQRSKFDPSDRDLPPEFINTGNISANIYKTPVQRWTEKGVAQTSPKALDLKLFPASILEPDWSVSVPVKTYDSSTLFEKVNGEADKFLQKGFEELQFIRIANSDSSAEIGIELFDQSNLQGSLGVFAEYVSKDVELQTTEGVVFISNSAGAIARKGKFFIRIVGNDESREITEKSNQLVSALSKLPEQEGEIPFEYKFLSEKLNVNPGRISFQPTNVFQFDFARNFWFGTPDPEKSGRVFFHQTESTDEATLLFKKLVEEQGFDHKAIRVRNTLAVMQHNFLKTWFILSREGSLIFGIDKMSDMETAQMTMQNISDQLANDEEGF